MLAKAGRAMKSKQLAKKAKNVGLDLDSIGSSTIACVSGFLLNMLDRSAALITPCMADETWPKGYWVLEEGRWETAEDLRELILGMIERNMSTSLSYRDPVAFRPDIKFEIEDDSVTLTSPYTKSTLSADPGMLDIAPLVARGDLSAGRIAILAEEEFGMEAALAFHTLNGLFKQGFLNEDPVFFSQKHNF